METNVFCAKYIKGRHHKNVRTGAKELVAVVAKAAREHGISETSARVFLAKALPNFNIDQSGKSRDVELGRLLWSEFDSTWIKIFCKREATDKQKDAVQNVMINRLFRYYSD